jgi:hypothetical protein
MPRQHRMLWIAALPLVAGLIAGGIVLALSGNSQAAPTKQEYFARVAAICRVYGPQLDKVPPPGDIATPAEIADPIKLALPLVVAELREVRALKPPTELKAMVDTWLALRDQAVAMMKRTLHEAELPDVRTMGPDWLRFIALQKQAALAGSKIGFPKVCSDGSSS